MLSSTLEQMFIIYTNGQWELKSRKKFFFKSHSGLKILTKFCSSHWPIFYLNPVKTQTYFFLKSEMKWVAWRYGLELTLLFLPDVILVGGLEKKTQTTKGGKDDPQTGPFLVLWSSGVTHMSLSHLHWHESGMKEGSQLSRPEHWNSTLGEKQ